MERLKRFYKRHSMAFDITFVSSMFVLLVFASAYVLTKTSKAVEKKVMPVAIKAAEKFMPTATAAEEIPSFSLLWSEYPSWSTFGVAHEVGIINGEKGKLGPIEKKWGVDIELRERKYDPCILEYGAGKGDAVCITNMDVLSPSMGIKSVAIAPTSTSYGADALIATNDITDVKQLEGKSIYLYTKSVSEYCIGRNLEILGEDASKYKYSHMEPELSSVAMQQKQKGFEAIVVWNPFVLQTLRNREGEVHVLFDSTKIPAEIIDMLVISQDSLNKPKGREFACAIIDTFYAISKRIAAPETHDDTVVGLGEKFSSLGLKDMEKALEQTIFFATPEQGIDLYTDGKIHPMGKNITDKTLKPIMEKVVDFCFKTEIITAKPKVSYGTKEDDSNLRFDQSFMQEVLSKQ